MSITSHCTESSVQLHHNQTRDNSRRRETRDRDETRRDETRADGASDESRPSAPSARPSSDVPSDTERVRGVLGIGHYYRRSWSAKPIKKVAGRVRSSERASHLSLSHRPPFRHAQGGSTRRERTERTLFSNVHSPRAAAAAALLHSRRNRVVPRSPSVAVSVAATRHRLIN